MGQVEPGTCLQKLVGSVRTGVILKDVSLEVHGGELTAVLGSKGSGKRALLEVISRRAQGPTRGQVGDLNKLRTINHTFLNRSC